ncbi:MAG TPA: sigma-70 family RNA polymerase sigma factor, partial [Actinoplanes sp.]|nr:sigma-70 family RNA polymerase sigma factor [Actinoplanes sp.]
YRGRGEPLEDLQQVARLGLVNAIDRYDPDRGLFTAFAVSTIRGELKRHFRDKTWRLHVTRRMQDLVLESQHATVLLTNTLNRDPSAAELADHLHVGEDEILHARLCRASYSPIPLSTPTGDGSTELGDAFGDHDEELESVTDKLTVTVLIQLLPDRIQRMLVMRFYGDFTQAKIAAELGISQMQVSRLLSRALSWLRAAMLSDVPPPWSGETGVHGSSGMRVRVTRSATTVNVQVYGEVDRDTADRLRVALRSALATATGGRVVVDVTAMPFVDAAGVAVLREAFAAGASAQVTVRLIGVQPHVATVLATVGLPRSND